MALVHYLAEVKNGLLLELPAAAKELHLKPGDKVDIQVETPRSAPLTVENDPTIALLESWIATAPTDPEAVREAEEDLREFKRNMNLPRRETGTRLHYPEAE